MAFYIQISKVEETETDVTYNYESNSPQTGIVQISKGSGNCEILQTIDGEIEDCYAKRACWALMRHWKEGVLPDKTYWAS